MPDNDSGTSLTDATRDGPERVVKILHWPEKVDPHKWNKDGRVLLPYAAQNGYEGVVKILPRQDEDKSEDRRGNSWTLFWAAELKGHE